MSDEEKVEESEQEEKTTDTPVQPTEEQLNPRAPKEVMNAVLESLKDPLMTMIKNINSLEHTTDKALVLQVALGIILTQVWVTGYTKLGVLEIIKRDFFTFMRMSHQQSLYVQSAELAKKVAEERETEIKKNNPYIT